MNLNPFKIISLALQRRRLMDIQTFAHHHRRYLVIIADPKDDTLFMAFRDKQVATKIKSADGKKYNVIQQVLRHSTFESSIDRFLAALIDAFQTPIAHFSEFGKWIDGALFNISRAIQKRQGEKSVYVNNLMQKIIEQKDHECYRRNKYKFSSNERKYIESKLNSVEVPAKTEQLT